MLSWKDFSPVPYTCYKHKKSNYVDLIFTFDIETTAFFKNPDTGEWTVDNGKWDLTTAQERVVTCYIWQFGINDTVYYGRELSEFKAFLAVLNKAYPERKIIYIHNLAYEFSFLCSMWNTTEWGAIFARQAHSPIYACLTSLNVEFRCSYILTNMSLDKAAKHCHCKHLKAIGDLNYNIARLSCTPLNEIELHYCEYDILVLYEIILFYKNRYGTIADIPLTQTGEVRREVKSLLSDYKYLDKIKEMYPDLNTYRILTRVFAGGYTHANYMFVGDVVKNIDSYDIASSYPYVMCTEMYPSYRFEKVKEIKGRNTYCYMGLVRLYDICAKSAWSYISFHKTEHFGTDTMVDNGRIFKSDYVELWLTDVDFDIISDNYKIGAVEWIEIYRAPKMFLPKKFVEYILKLYSNKTTLKGVAGMEAEYIKAKQFINAMFGMTVTNDIRDLVGFDFNTREWKVDELSLDDIAKKLKAPHFLNFAWGIWVTAYARRNLWRMINRIGNDVLYCDTDSAKIIHGENYRAVFEEYNSNVLNKLENVSTLRQIPLELFMPKDRKGNKRPMGVFEHETFDGRTDTQPTYDEFKTYGAKKYAYVVNGQFSHTISGCAKSFIQFDGNAKCLLWKKFPTIKSMDDFNLKTVVKHARRVAWYNNNQPEILLTDYLGNTAVNHEKSGMVLQDSTYTLDIADTFKVFIEHALNSTHNVYSNPFRKKF